MSIAEKSSHPFEDVRALALRPVEPDQTSADWVHQKSLSFGRAGDFGRLGEAASWLAAWQRRAPPRIEKPTLVMFAGAHGLAENGLSMATSDGIKAHIDALNSGTAPLSAIATLAGAEIRIMELALSVPTKNIAEAPAMTEKECAATIAYGFEALAGGPDIIALGVSGAGIGTAAAAVACALYGGSAEYWVRPSPDVPETITQKRIELVNAALKHHRGHIGDPLEALARLGGRELAACVGAILAARIESVPILLDGFATTVAAAIVHTLNPQAIQHVWASHETRRPAHSAILERIGLKPLLDLEFQTGGGLGSTAAISLLRTACAPFMAEPEPS